jgi:hypothetical protein
MLLPDFSKESNLADLMVDPCWDSRKKIHIVNVMWVTNGTLVYFEGDLV